MVKRTAAVVIANIISTRTAVDPADPVVHAALLQIRGAGLVQGMNGDDVVLEVEGDCAWSKGYGVGVQDLADGCALSRLDLDHPGADGQSRLEDEGGDVNVGSDDGPTQPGHVGDDPDQKVDWMAFSISDTHARGNDDDEQARDHAECRYEGCIVARP